MYPSSCIPLAAENEYWTDEGIFMSLLDFKSGKPLPWNVTSDVNPYQYKPSDLPVDLWYFCCGLNKDTEGGFWLATGEASEIFSNSDFHGLRTTLQFYEGRAPHVQKTDWVMQEYRITEKCNNSSKDYGALCRVFLVDVNRPPSRLSVANIDVKISINLENDTGPPLMTKRSPDPFLENAFEMDCFLRGDYFELNDLVDPGSRSSSSANSSCLSMTSDEYFDSMALLREIEDDIKDQHMKDRNVKYNLSAPVMSKEVVIHPATSVFLTTDQDCKPSAKDTSKMDNESTSNGVLAATSSLTSSENKSKEAKKECVSSAKRHKVIKYICFLAF